MKTWQADCAANDHTPQSSMLMNANSCAAFRYLSPAVAHAFSSKKDANCLLLRVLRRHVKHALFPPQDYNIKRLHSLQSRKLTGGLRKMFVLLRNHPIVHFHWKEDAVTDNMRSDTQHNSAPGHMQPLVAASSGMATSMTRLPKAGVPTTPRTRQCRIMLPDYSCSSI